MEIDKHAVSAFDSRERLSDTVGLFFSLFDDSTALLVLVRVSRKQNIKNTLNLSPTRFKTFVAWKGRGFEQSKSSRRYRIQYFFYNILYLRNEYSICSLFSNTRE